MSDTRTRLLGVVTQCIGAIEFATDPMERTLESLKMDSLDVVDLIMSIEDEFRIEITDDEAEPFAANVGHAAKTLGDLLALVEQKLAGKVSA